MANRQAESAAELLSLDLEELQRKGVNQHRGFRRTVVGTETGVLEQTTGEVIFRPIGNILMSEIVVRFDFDDVERAVASPGNYNAGLAMIVEDGSAKAFVEAALESGALPDLNLRSK